MTSVQKCDKCGAFLVKIINAKTLAATWKCLTCNETKTLAMQEK